MGKFKSSDTAREGTDLELKEQESEMLLGSAGKLAMLKPKISDKETFDKLVAAVDESTRKNESVAEFQARISKLGKAVVDIASKVAGLL